MQTVMVIGSIWLMCAFCAVLFVRGASSQTSLRRVPVLVRNPRRGVDMRRLGRPDTLDF